MKHKIAPSLLAADFLNLQKEVEMINNSEADWLHMDIMDGVFVPNISFPTRRSSDLLIRLSRAGCGKAYPEKADGCASDDRRTPEVCQRGC